VLDTLAVHRLTRLVIADTILDRPRELWVEAAYIAAGRAQEVREVAEMSSWAEVAQDEGRHAPKLATLLTCRWCASTHIAVGVALLAWKFPKVWAALRRPLALSSAATLLARLEED
jgi:hypothetical protein